jgi:hypothetical protein
MRRRLRAVRRDRDAHLLELGALVFELRRRGRDAPALVEAAIERARVLDEEERALVAAVAGPEVVAAAPAAPECATCHAPLHPGGRFCAACGAPVAASAPTAEPPAIEPGRRPPEPAPPAAEPAPRTAGSAPLTAAVEPRPAEPSPRRLRENDGRAEVPAER